MGEMSSLRKTTSLDFFFSSSSLRPYWASRASHSAVGVAGGGGAVQRVGGGVGGGGRGGEGVCGRGQCGSVWVGALEGG